MALEVNTRLGPYEILGRRVTTNESTWTVFGLMLLIAILIAMIVAVTAAQRAARTKGSVKTQIAQ